jgi:hypothetical protein
MERAGRGLELSDEEIDAYMWDRQPGGPDSDEDWVRWSHRLGRWAYALAVSRLTIKMPAEEPTGAELVGKVCEFSLDGKVWLAIGRCDKYRSPDARDPFCFFCGQGGPRYGWWSHARLYRGDRP